MAVRQFGTYQILRKIGRSMTDVYLALDASERRVVLKIVEQSPDPLTQSVLEAERRGAIIQQQLHTLDPRIPEVYEYGEQDNCYFVAMEYCEGRNLFELLRMETRLDPLRAARYAAEVCSQLHTLHSFQADIDGRKRAIVHGDIKPANIQIAAGDRARLLDFGIAKTITLTRNLTRHDLGSPAYCSPERLKNAQVDARADLWALGVTLYELVAGLPPYQAQTTRKLENLIQSRRPPRALPGDCPPALKAIIGKAIAPDPVRRYDSATAFETDLRAFLEKRRTVAEMDRLPSWDANATIEKRPPTLPLRRDRQQKLTHIVQEANRTIWALAAGLIAGLIVLIPPGYLYRFWHESAPLRAGQDYAQHSTAEMSSDWLLYKGLEQQNAFLHGFSPIGWVKEPLRARLISTADGVIGDYRNTSDRAPEHFDWEKAQTALKYALELDSADAHVRSEEALSDGYLALAHNADSAKKNFEQAAEFDRRSPDPHLALARLYAYADHNAGQTVAELQQAERLGFHPGPRETEEEGDAYLYRGQEELREATKPGLSADDREWSLAASERDLARARELYEPISGFSNVSRSLEQLRHDDNLRRMWLKSIEDARAERRAAAARPKKTPRRGKWR